MDYTFVQGRGWLKASPSAVGAGLWIKTSEHGVILPDDEIPALIGKLQAYMSMRARERAREASGGR